MLTFDQANPALVASERMSDLFAKKLQNQKTLTDLQYYEPTLAESLKKSQLDNEVLGVKAQYAPQNALADLLQKQAVASLTGQQAKWYGPEAQARIGLEGAQTKEATSLLPYKIQDAKFKMENPLLGLTGEAAQVGALQYLLQHPELSGAQQSQVAPSQISAPSMQPGASGVIQGNLRSLFSPNLSQQIQQQPAPQNQQQFPMGGSQLGNIPQQYDSLSQYSSQMNQPTQQPQSLADIMRQNIINSMQEKQAKANYLNSMPMIRTLTNPAILAAAATDENVAKSMLTTLGGQIDKGFEPSDQQVKDFQQYASDATLRKTKTAVQINQMQYASNLDALMAQGSELMPSVSQYTGVQGKLKLASDAAQASIGNVSPEYSDFLKFTRVTVPEQAGEISRTLGKNATDMETKILTNVVDPTYWDSNPTLALEQWKWLVNSFQGKHGINKSLAKSNADIRKSLEGSSDDKIANGKYDTSSLSDDQIESALLGGE